MKDPFDPSVIGPISVPTEDELRPHMLERWESQAKEAIDQWPEEIAALSVKTHLIPIDTNEIKEIYDNPESEAWLSAMNRYAALIDEKTGWNRHFIKLSTRSPKDATMNAPTITLSGKQAMDWISNSERCLDDIYMAHIAKKPIYIAVREIYHAAPGGEFRCFAKDGKLIAVSRYDYHKEAQIEYPADKIFQQLSDWYEENIAAHYQTVVFDVELGCYDRDGQPLLIELNPYGLSDPCLFRSYEAIEQEGGFRA